MQEKENHENFLPVHKVHLAETGPSNIAQRPVTCKGNDAGESPMTNVSINTRNLDADDL